ncbi:hypothetical protein N8804_01350 [Methylophilaceae bacterium]|nr:hypothetical protein [Methylophilaceae bacterium]
MKKLLLLLFLIPNLVTAEDKDYKIQGYAYADCAGFYTFSMSLYERANEISDEPHRELTNEDNKMGGFFAQIGELEYSFFHANDIPPEIRHDVAKKRFQKRLFSKAKELVDLMGSDMEGFKYSFGTLKTMCHALYESGTQGNLQ